MALLQMEGEAKSDRLRRSMDLVLHRVAVVGVVSMHHRDRSLQASHQREQGHSTWDRQVSCERDLKNHRLIVVLKDYLPV